MSDPRVVYGARCSWWDTIDKIATSSSGLPVCPYCASPLFETTDLEEWYRQVDAHERSAPEPGYRIFVEWLRGRCFPAMGESSGIERARAAFALELEQAERETAAGRGRSILCAADGDHDGDVVPVFVSGVYGVPAGTSKVVGLCGAHRTELAALEAVFEPETPPAEIKVPTWVVEKLVQGKWPIGSELFPELVAAYARGTLEEVPRMGPEDLDLDLGLESILNRYRIPLHELGDDGKADRGDLASDLADEARRFFRRPGALTARPPWGLVRDSVGWLETLVEARGVGAISDLDQIRAEIIEQLDKLEITLHDERAVYEGLVWIALVVELARNGLEKKSVGLETYRSISSIVTTIAAALLPYLPPEARSR